jgi:DNA-binding response OmpR family regulator
MADRNERHDILRFGDVTVNREEQTVVKNGIVTVMTSKEHLLLCVLLENVGQTVTRDELYESVWGEPYLGNSRTIDAHISRIRRKLGWRRELLSVMNVGYCLADLPK